MRQAIWVVVLAAVGAGGLTAGQTAAGHAASSAKLVPGNGEAPALQTYTNAELHLTFAYPAAMRRRATDDTTAVGQRIVLGEKNDPNADPSKAAPCTRTLMAAETRGGTQAAGTLILFDVDLRCIPPKAMKNKKLLDTVLSGFVTQGTSSLGMMPVGPAMGYWLQGHHAFFAASQGEPVNGSGLQSNGSAMWATVAAGVGDHVFVWMLEAGSPELLRAMMTSRVDFGTGTPVALFPFSVH